MAMGIPRFIPRLPFAQQVLELGFRPQLITHLARPLSNEDVEALYGFS